MTQRDKSRRLRHGSTQEPHNNNLANVMAAHNWKNLRVAEAEKYAHVTYFFNGGNEKPYAGEEREMVASPKVATYDLKPEMSAAAVADVGTNAIDKDHFDILLMNFPNATLAAPSAQHQPPLTA